MVQFEDRAVTGELIKAMPEADRWFEIIDKPYYEEIKGDTPEDLKRKLAIPIRFSDGRQGVYFPNKTSCRMIDRLANTLDMDSWVGLKFFWGRVLEQNVFGEVKQVPYVTSVYPQVDHK